VDNRAGYLQPRSQDTVCRIHRQALDETGWCAVAQAWWYPKFACPACHGWLWENGFCPTCTPRTLMFPGDYFAVRHDDGAGREWLHFVREHRGPTPVPTPAETDAFFAQLKAIAAQSRGLGLELTEPAWITEDA
jgi:hypothetical protein